jgi:PD-(D/E)XK nuclease superfamily
MKRMMEKNGSVYYVNASSVDILTTCPRKAEYSIKRKMRKEEEGEALVFGSAIHSALEAFYKATPGTRTLSEMVEAFNQAAGELHYLPETEKRSVSNGHKILGRYFSTYGNDPWVTYVDEKGPFVERSFELPFKDNLYVHGQIDCALQNTETGEVVICDHKTTSSCSDLINRVKPNTQFSLYAWAAVQMGLPVKRVMVNGIQVAKTKSDFLRIFTDRGEDDFRELELSLDYAVHLYNRFDQSEAWPMNTSSCSNYGGCQYLSICQLDRKLRESAIQSIYPGR